jgi:Domain of unknown function (DUF4815)
MEFNVDPYYDDFKQNALDNNYLRILFKPGQAVQARELTQIQSILQNQIKQFGDHIFQNGSPVIGGNMSLDNKVKYLKLQTTYNNQDVNIDDFSGNIIRSSDGTVQAKVLTTYYPTDATPTLLVKYITGNEFSDGSVITIATTTTQAQLIGSGSSGLASICSINEGVFYVDGFFIKVQDQTTPVNPYGVSANVKVGLQISDDIVDYLVDTTLLDPAQGSFNYQAPGADRYQFNLTLSTRPIDTVVDESRFFELMRIENGVITKQVKYPVYAELEKSLARRTFDQAGDYTVAPFRATLTDGVDANNYTIAIEPGKAYIKGFEFETLGTVKVDIAKPRSAADVKSYVDIDVDTSYGNYIYVTALRGSVNGFINISALETVDIHTVDSSKVAVNLGTSANVQIYANTKIGTAKIKTFSRDSADAFNANTDSNGVYKLYLSDVRIQPKIVKVSAASSNANSIRLSDKFSITDNAYTNVQITILPIRLDAVANINVANVFAYSYTLNANSAVANTCNVFAVGDIIRVGDMVRQVTSINVTANTLTVNSAWTQTIIGTNNSTNPLGVFKQTSYSQNVVNQIRTIKRYDGATATAFLDSNFDNSGIADANTVVQINYSIADADSFIAGPAVAANNLIAPIANASMNVSSVGKLTDGSTYINEPTNYKLIFPLPGNYTKRGSLNNVDYIYNKLVPNRANSGTLGQFILSQSSGLESFETIPFADSTGAIRDNLIVVVKDNGGNTTFSNGSIIQLTASNITISGTGDQITIDTPCPEIKTADILINVKENNIEGKIRKKVFMSNTVATVSPFTYPTSNTAANVQVTLSAIGNTVASIDVANGYIWLANANYNSVRQGDTISLFTPDVIKIRKILAGNTTHFPDANNYRDVTQSFGINFGVNDDMYDHASLQLLSGYDTVNAKMLVHVDMYQHIYASGSNLSYFSADSYAQSIYDAGQIPIYKSTATNQTYYLRDCLDFRPTRQIGDVSNIFQVPNIPSPDYRTELSFDYYLPRIDKLVLSKDKEFRVIQGKSAARPIPPNDVDDAMTLFQINLPPYVADIREARLKYFDNRRFTMKDIASISKQVNQLSYYVSLSNAENLAIADPTQYEDGTDKAKYGIVGENFTNFNIADYKNREFNVALDNGLMTPAIQYFMTGLKEISKTAIAQNMKTVSLSYTETPAITQGVTADKAVSVQPFLFGAFNGTLEMYPDTDYWVSQQLKPEVIAPPETIITEKIVIREKIIEVAAPVTVRTPTSNANTVISTTPGGNPTSNANSNVVVTPSDPGPVIVIQEPAMPSPSKPPDPPQTYQCIEYAYIADPWQDNGMWDTNYWGGYYGVYPALQCTSYGTLTGSNWFPEVNSQPPPPPIEVTPIVVSQPIYAGGGGCPDPSMLILLADGTWIAAGDLQIGMMLRTQHENTFEWGEFQVIAKEIVTQPKLELTFGTKTTVVSKSHRFWVDSKTAWINSEHLEIGDIINGYILTESKDLVDGPVVKITVDEAHTYIMEGLLSHNVKVNPGYEADLPAVNGGGSRYGSNQNFEFLY